MTLWTLTDEFAREHARALRDLTSRVLLQHLFVADALDPSVPITPAELEALAVEFEAACIKDGQLQAALAACESCEFCGEVPDETGCRCADTDARIYDRLEQGE